MFFILSKIISWVILPINQILLALGLSAFLKSHQWKKVFRYVFISTLVVYTSPLTSHFALHLWEVPAISNQSIDKAYDVGIVLTGMTNMRALPTDRPHFGEAADRIIDAITLYKEGKIKKLLISGGSGHLLYPDLKESLQLKEFAILMGVIENDIFVETDSQNTRQNALNSSFIIKNHWPEASVLLITSATHMKRASACFSKVGLDPDIYSTDIKSTPFNWDFKLLIPSTGALVHWTTITREIVGCVAYWFAGYI